jgi:hypothetical protein
MKPAGQPMPAPAKPEPSVTQYFPEPFQVLGSTLLPLSIGRYRLLRLFNVPFVADGQASVSVEDLILAVLICSLPVDEFYDRASSMTFGKEIEAWSRQINARPPRCFTWGQFGRLLSLSFIGKRWRRKHSFNLIEKAQLFRRYIEDSAKLPDFWDLEPGNAPPTGASWDQNIEVTLRSQLGWSRHEINEAPIGKAIYDFYAYLEGQGRISLIDPNQKLEAEPLSEDSVKSQIDLFGTREVQPCL